MLEFEYHYKTGYRAKLVLAPNFRRDKILRIFRPAVAEIFFFILQKFSKFLSELRGTCRSCGPSRHDLRPFGCEETTVLKNPAKMEQIEISVIVRKT